MKKQFLTLLLLLFLSIIVTDEVLAQCPMCRATAETNLANGGSEGAGLNSGILYLLGMPYVLIGTVAFLWWKNKKEVVEDAS